MMITLCVVDPGGADMQVRVEDRTPETAELLGDRIREVADRSGDDRRVVLAIRPRRGDRPQTLCRSVPADALDEIHKLMDGQDPQMQRDRVKEGL